MRHRLVSWLYALLVSGALCVYLIGNQSVGLFDRDEPRYAQTSRQMLQSGDWVVPHFLDKIRTAKPVLIYWCQASAMAVLGDTGFAARLPSALGVTATVALVAVVVGRARGATRGLWTGFVLASCGMAMVSAKMCLTDGVLLLFVTTSQLCLYRLWRSGPDVRTVVLLGVSIGLAGLTKGPVALGINGITLLALWGLGRTTTVKPRTPFSGVQWLAVGGAVLAIVTVIALPWLWEIHRRAPEFLRTALGHDVLDRMQHGQEGHSAPPGFYSLIVWGTFFPWSLLLPAAVWWGWKRRHLSATRFALAAWIGPWVMFECIATKLPHYVLPTYPALAYLTADLLTLAQRGRIKDLSTRAFRNTVWGWAVLVGLMGLAAPAALLAIGQADQRAAVGAVTIAILGLSTGVFTATRFRAGRIAAAARMMGGGTLAVVAAAYGLFLPHFAPLQLSHDVATILIDHGGYAQPGMMIDFKEPSLAFAQGGGLREQSDDHFLNHAPPSAWPTWMVLSRRVWDGTRDDVRQQWDVVGRATGIAYSDGGDRREVLVLRRLSE